MKKVFSAALVVASLMVGSLTGFTPALAQLRNPGIPAGAGVLTGTPSGSWSGVGPRPEYTPGNLCGGSGHSSCAADASCGGAVTVPRLRRGHRHSHAR